VLAPWSFRIGARWTPAVTWSGFGRLRDSSGAQYGLFVSFSPNLRGGAGRISRANPLFNYGLRGTGWVCTGRGTRYRFDLRGGIYGLWRDTDGAYTHLSLAEPRGPKNRRQFDLYGEWHGPQLVLDDHKSMFIHFLPDGSLTPARGYTSPVPEKHANVTLSWGTERDFESLCETLTAR
jgi:hypothetical protein